MLKTRFLFFFFLLLFFTITLKLFYIQVLNTDSYDSDYIKKRRIYPERGKIFDRNLQPLATNKITYLLFAEPKKITDRRHTIEDIDSILHIGEATLEARLDDTKDWVSLRSGVSEQQKAELTKVIPQGIGFDEEIQRYYPEASLSAHLLGFVGKNKDGENTGYFGLEGYYEQELVGLPGLMKSERDLAGRPIFFGVQERLNPQPGRDLVLTIDKSVQGFVKNRLKKALEMYKAKAGCVIVADPNTMAILGIVCLPDFDPEKYYDFTGNDYRNSAISDSYEPGSTFKPLIMAAGIEEKVIQPDEFMNEDGPVSIGEYKISTWDNKYAGRISMTQILEKSSNVGMVYIGNKLGQEKVYNYVQKYGFGKITGIDLQGEVSGVLKPKGSWYPIDYATATFGQGVAVTPIQMIRAFSSIINGGKLLKPYVVAKTVMGDEEKVREPQVINTTVSKRTSDIIKKMLVDTVENGEVKWAKPKGYTIGGKTGTAQIPVEGHYDPSKTIASFIGFAPADKPKFVILTILKEPGTSIYGAETAAPLFFDITGDLLSYYNIPPDRNE